MIGSFTGAVASQKVTEAYKGGGKPCVKHMRKVQSLNPA